MYGLAPTEIICHIALSYILGFNEDTKDIKHNFRQLDALPYAKEGTLQQKLDELFSWLPLPFSAQIAFDEKSHIKLYSDRFSPNSPKRENPT